MKGRRDYIYARARDLPGRYVTVNISCPIPPSCGPAQKERCAASSASARGAGGTRRRHWHRRRSSHGFPDCRPDSTRPRVLPPPSTVECRQHDDRPQRSPPPPPASRGLSGAPLYARSTAALRSCACASCSIPIIGVGGISTAATQRKIAAAPSWSVRHRHDLSRPGSDRQCVRRPAPARGRRVSAATSSARRSRRPAHLPRAARASMMADFSRPRRSRTVDYSSCARARSCARDGSTAVRR